MPLMPEDSIHSEPSEIVSENIQVERFRLDPSVYAALPTIVDDDQISEATTSIVLGQSDSSTSAGHVESEEKQDASVIAATLQRSAIQDWISTLIDVLISLIPLFFLVITILCLCLDGKPISAYGQDIKAITLLSPIVFPIVYAAILGKLLRRIALFKAERSASVGTLEQLIGSQSFFTSLERQFGMRRINFLGIGISMAWLLSPLGGQSSLRLLSTQVAEKPVAVPVRYHAIDIFGRWTMGGEHLEDYYWASYAPLFISALQTSRDNFNESKDLFGNLRIPDITSLEEYTNPTPAPDDWYKVDHKPSVAYTSLLGAPIKDVPAAANITFATEKGYWAVSCSPFSSNFSLHLINNTRINAKTREASFDMEIELCDWCMQSEAELEETAHSTVANFTYFSRISPEYAISSNCTAELRAVHSEVRCIEGDCEVRRMRHSTRNMWPIFTNASSWHHIRWVTNFLPGTDIGPGSVRLRASELIEQWMVDPYLLNFLPNYGGQSWKGVHLAQNLSIEVLSRRLQMVLNTFTDSWMGVDYRAGLDREESAPWNSTEAFGTQFDTERYLCNTTFAALTIIISLLLFVAATTSLFLGITTRAPDILGYVSTLARDNPFLQEHIPSHLNGLEAARALRDVRVIIGDVKKDSDVGHVAFASLRAEPGRVSRKRLYN